MSAETQAVYKYPLPIDEWVCVWMPRGAVPLCVQTQHGMPFLWARVQRENTTVAHHFRIAGTGHDLGSNVGEYVGTFQLSEGALVFHVFAEDAS